MADVPHWWRPDVYEAFLEAVGRREARRHGDTRAVTDEALGEAAA